MAKPTMTPTPSPLVVVAAVVEMAIPTLATQIPMVGLPNPVGAALPPPIPMKPLVWLMAPCTLVQQMQPLDDHTHH